MKDVDWKRCFEGKDAHGMWDQFKEVLMSGQNNFMPFRHLRNEKKSKPRWYGNEVRNSIREKKKAFKKYKTYPTADNEELKRQETVSGK